jgi:hypothetical protein
MAWQQRCVLYGHPDCAGYEMVPRDGEDSISSFMNTISSLYLILFYQSYYNPVLITKEK